MSEGFWVSSSELDVTGKQLGRDQAHLGPFRNPKDVHRIRMDQEKFPNVWAPRRQNQRHYLYGTGMCVPTQNHG